LQEITASPMRLCAGLFGQFVNNSKQGIQLFPFVAQINADER
jgi:hypothetical protein